MGNPPPHTPAPPMSPESSVAAAAKAVKRTKPSHYRKQEQPQQQDYRTLRRLIELEVPMEMPRGRKSQPSRSSSSASTSSRAALGALLPSRINHADGSRGGPRRRQGYCGGRMAGCSVSLCSLRESSKVMHRPDHGMQPNSPLPDLLGKSKNPDIYSSPSTRKPPASPVTDPRKSPRTDINRHVLSPFSSSFFAGTGAVAPAASPASSYGTTSFGGSRSFRSSCRLNGGCYECQHMVAQQSDRPLGCGFSREGSLRSSALCACPDCGELFAKAESLEHHRAVRHAVTDLGPDDSSRSVVEIIFRSSWRLRTPRPPGGPPRLRIDRVLKINNPPGTLAAFEAYRSHVRLRATFTPAANSVSSPTNSGNGRQRYPRCTADGNELLRFRAAHLACGIGRAGGATTLCNEGACASCTIIRVGFKLPDSHGAGGLQGILTLASSGRAHEVGEWPKGVGNGETAMLVCRVIAGRVTRQTFKNGGNNVPVMPPPATSTEWEYDSVAVAAPGVRAGERMDELYVFNPKAILPCFIVVYRCL